MAKSAKTERVRDAATGKFLPKSAAFDSFSSPWGRTGAGTPSINEAAGYVMERWTNNYYLLLTLIRNSWVARKIVNAPAQDMTKSWPRLTAALSPEDISLFDRAIGRTGTPAKIRHTLELGRLFGGAGALIVIKGHERKLAEPLEWDEVQPGSYLGLIPFDRWSGIQPGMEICTDVNRPHDFGLPEYYTLTQQELDPAGAGTSTTPAGITSSNDDLLRVHSSRILRFTGPMVPNPEFQANQRWGISVLEPTYHELKSFDAAVASVGELMNRANILAQTNDFLAQKKAAMGGSSATAFQEEMQRENWLLSTQSMLILPKEGKLENFQYSFGGVAEVLLQAMIRVAGAAEMPVTRIFGRVSGGLGDTGEAEERVYEENIHRKQVDEVEPQLLKLYPVVCMSELGEVPDDLGISWPSIRVLTEKDKAETAKAFTEAILAPYNAAIEGYGSKTVLTALRNAGDSLGGIFPITDEMIAKASDDPPAMEGLEDPDNELEKEKGEE